MFTGVKPDVGVYHGPSAKEPTMSDPDEQSELPPAARRALAEAEERRKSAKQKLPRELGGREGPDPVRFGDWEKKGIAVDF